MRGRGWLSIVSGDGVILIIFFNLFLYVFGVFFLKIMMLWFSLSHRNDSFIIAQALNSWVTIDLKKVTNLFGICLF